MSSSEKSDNMEGEVAELKSNAKNLTNSLTVLLKRIDELESRKGGQTADVHRFMTAPERTVVETSETNDEGGVTRVTKKVHVTERLVTSSSTLPPSDHSRDFLEQWAMRTMQNGLQSPSLVERPSEMQPVTIGIQRPKGQGHLLGTAYSARLGRVESSSCRASSSSSSSNVNEGIDPLLQGLDLKEHDGQLVVEKIPHDSAFAKQGLLNVGDHVLEVNGIEVKTADDFCQRVKSSGDSVTVKVVPATLDSALSGTFVRASVDYDPVKDDKLKEKEIGLSFNAGDVLQVTKRDDAHYWQARKVNDMSRVGLIPSDTATILTSAKRSTLNLHVYEEVGKWSPYGRRVLVLLGASGVGRRTLKSMLLLHDRNNFATVTPFTSRPTRAGEQEGREYRFESKEGMQSHVDKGHFLEYGQYGGNFYGTMMDSIRQVVRAGRVCVLDCTAQAVARLYTREFMPYIVFVAPPSLEELKQLYRVHPRRTKPKTEEELKKACEESALLQSQYQHLVDLVLVNRNVDVTFRRLVDALESLKAGNQWVPLNWLS